LSVNGDLTVGSMGVLDMVVAGSDQTQYAHLDVTGTTAVSGTVLIDFQNGFAPKAGDSFDLFTVAGGMSSLGSNIEGAGLAPGWQFSVADENGDTFVDSRSDGVATSPEPSAVAIGRSHRLSPSCRHRSPSPPAAQACTDRLADRQGALRRFKYPGLTGCCDPRANADRGK
jgi:hypothetical protein